MKVVAFNGSPRKNGNTAFLIEQVFKELEKQGIVTEQVHLSGKPLCGCIACYLCNKNKDRRCAVQTDALNEHIEKMLDADGIILASPSYFQNVTSEMKALIDRTGFVARSNDRMFKHKIGGSVAVQRRTGAIHALDAIDHFFLANQMFIAGRAAGIGHKEGDVEKDASGVSLARSLGRNMAWLMGKLHG